MKSILMEISDVDTAWDNFLNNSPTTYMDTPPRPPIRPDYTPKCSDIYISTQTKIIFMNQPIDLERIFWKIPIIEYQTRADGILKKQMKINCNSKEESALLGQRIASEEMVIIDIISKVDNPNARKIKYKDVRKVNIGLSRKDLVSYRKRRKGAFYNCFVLIMRLGLGDGFKEVHLKVFNTGKLEIPGVQNNIFLYKALDKLITILQPFCKAVLTYEADRIETVLINSNFSCNYFIDRNRLYNIIKYKYHLNAIYDPCSYPGIQCKFHYRSDKPENNGICQYGGECGKMTDPSKPRCCVISFMIFRTGSVLIVGHCEEEVLVEVYRFLKDLLLQEYPSIYVRANEGKKKPKNKKVWRKTILVDIEPVNKSEVGVTS